jgi:RNA ligase (TIGR02306 family)
MRQLATIRQITSKHPIPNKDRIELCMVDGWSVIAKKDEFSIGDLCLFYEIDSFLPLDERYSFLSQSKRTYGNTEGYRIKTMKLSGALSQGLALPLHMFPEIPNPTLGDDVTDLLKVIKYDLTTLDEANPGNVKVGKPSGSFPSFIPKTDEPRIQNLTQYFELFKDHLFEETLKLDGSSMTCYKIATEPTLWQRIKALFTKPVQSYHFGVCSRNMEIAPDSNYTKTYDNDSRPSIYSSSDFWTAAIKYDIESKLPIGYAVQGELIGPRIQANHEKVSTLEYYIYHVWDITQQRYLLPDERDDFVRQYTLPHVPFVSYTYIFQDRPTLDLLLERVVGESMNPGTVSEGRVYKSITLPNLSFKVISNEYLLTKEK